MRTTLAITRRELSVYFTSPMGYVVAGVFLALTGFFFVDSIEGQFREAGVRVLLLNSAFFLLPLMPPILTMRLFAEEQKMGTLELLLTAPARDYQVVLGKWLASLLILGATVLLTLFYIILLFVYADPDPGPIFTAYVGFLLYSATALAIGLLASSLSANQIVSAVLGFGIILIFTVIQRVSTILGGPVATVVEQLSLSSHFEAFARGVISTADVAYYLLLTSVFLFLTIRSIESRRWR